MLVPVVSGVGLDFDEVDLGSWCGCLAELQEGQQLLDQGRIGMGLSRDEVDSVLAICKN